MLEVNPQPGGAFAGGPYAYGLFFDNTSQSYFNLGSNDYSDMDGKIYFGALFGELDYYFFLGDGAPNVLALTGRAPMPPKYVPPFTWHAPRWWGPGASCRLAMNGYANIAHLFESAQGH